MRLGADFIRHEGADRGARLETAMRAVVDFRRGAFVRALERKRHRTQRGGKFLIGETGHEQAAIDVGDVGDGFQPAVLAGAGGSHDNAALNFDSCRAFIGASGSSPQAR